MHSQPHLSGDKVKRRTQAEIKASEGIAVTGGNAKRQRRDEIPEMPAPRIKPIPSRKRERHGEPEGARAPAPLEAPERKKLQLTGKLAAKFPHLTDAVT